MAKNERNAGRKKKNNEEKRVHRKSLYLSKQELRIYKILEEALKNHKKGTIQEYLRNSLISGVQHFHPEAFKEGLAQSSAT